MGRLREIWRLAEAQNRQVRGHLMLWGHARRVRGALYVIVLIVAIAHLVVVHQTYLWEARPQNFGNLDANTASGVAKLELSDGRLVEWDSGGGRPYYFFEFDIRYRSHGNPEIDTLRVAATVGGVWFSGERDATTPEDVDLPLLLAEQTLDELVAQDAPIRQRLTVERQQGGPPPAAMDLYGRPTADPETVVLTLSDPGTARRNAWRHIAFALRTAWVIPLAVMTTGEIIALFGRRCRLFPADHCQSCGYPLGDLPDLVCPECGRTSPFARR